MELKWTSKAHSDLVRLYDFMASANKPAALRVVQALSGAASDLRINPRIGERLDEFDPREVRRLLVGRYEMRYEVQGETLYVLRIWHTRENR